MFYVNSVYFCRMFMKQEDITAQLFVRLQNRLQQTLPGFSSHRKMIPEDRINISREAQKGETIRYGAVLIALFSQNKKIHTVLIKRNTYDGVHSGQIAFPGGRLEEHDADLVQTAIREAEEEVNISSSKVRILGTLSRIYIPPSRFEVLPVIGMLSSEPQLKPDINEVEEVFTCRLYDLINPANRYVKPIKLADGQVWDVPCIIVGNHFIWGATSMIISELADVLTEISFNQE